MNLMVLTASYPPTRGAASVRMSEMVAAFAGQQEVEHITVLVYRPEQKTEHPRRHVRMSDKINVVYYGRRFAPRNLHRLPGLNPLTLGSWVHLALREARKASPDVILATIPPRFNPAIAAYIASVFCRRPFCIDIRDPWVKASEYSLTGRHFVTRSAANLAKRIMSKLFLRACRKALLISVVYDSLGEYLATQCNITTPTLVVQNGVNFAEIEQVARDFDRRQVLLKNGVPYGQDAKFVIHAGMVGAYYKPEVLLEPLRRLREKGRNIAYIVVGDGPSRQSLAAMATSSGLHDSVFLLGARAHSDVLELLLASDVGVFPLSNDHPNPGCDLGVKVLEYVACRLPILSLARHGSAVSEMVARHKLGIALKWGEVQEVDNALERLLDDSQEYVRNIERYYPIFVKEFDRAKNNRRLLHELSTLWKGCQ